jgi:hypothetical protein
LVRVGPHPHALSLGGSRLARAAGASVDQRRPSVAQRLLARAVVAAADKSKIIGIRAGAETDHRYVGVWPIVVEGRLFARSWTLKPTGWYRTFLEDPLGTIQVGERQIKIRAVPVKSARLLTAIEDGYATKYPTPGSRTYVRGFKTSRRRAATMEFVRR